MPVSGASHDMEALVGAYTSHLETLQAVFNEHARKIGLGVLFSPQTAIEMAKKGRGLSSIIRFAERKDDTGVLHPAQLMTALDAIAEMLTSPLRNGLILGAMQSGKTTTSLALQLAGPIIYLLTGRTTYPVYLITSQTGQEDQTKLELERFLELYGEVDIRVDEEHHCTLIEYIRNVAVDPRFGYSPTINTYRGHVLGGALPDPTLIGPQLEDFVQRRVRGESLKRVARICRAANDQGFSPVLIIDEPQFGASDRFVKNDEGAVERKPCVLLQMFQKIDEALGADAGEHTFIGLSATPFELHDLQAVWEVPQYLTSDYTGFNFFGGEVIDGTARVCPPRTVALAELAKEMKVPFLGSVSMAVYDGSEARFNVWAKKNNYKKTQEEYRQEVEEALRQAITKIVADAEGRPIGICVRLLNNNARSHQLLRRLMLDPKKIEIVEYFGGEHKGESVKRAISRRQHRSLPFVIAVTNRARMGDAFPASVEWFFEFAQKAGDLNALLQGLLGRACGYRKSSTVVMSQDNMGILREYVGADGRYTYKTSRHSKVFGYRRGAPTTLLRIKRDWDDPLVREFFKQLDAEIVQPLIKPGTRKIESKRAANGDFRRGPLLLIAERLGLFDYLEEQRVRERLLPDYPEFRIARMGDRVPKGGNSEELLGYQLDDDGNCRFTFRTISSTGTHGGMRSRGLGNADAADRAKTGDKLEPQVNMEKFDPATGEKIEDPAVPGNWRAVMVTMPLLAPVQALKAGDVVFPVEASPFSALMSEDEREMAGYVDEPV